jgi:general secretion pathway protein M
MSTRRQVLTIAAGLVLILAAAQWVVAPMLRRGDRALQDLQRAEQRLQELLRLERSYRQVRTANARLERQLGQRRGDFNLFAFLERLADRDGLKQQIDFMRPSVKALNETHEETQVEMRLSGVSLERLIPYLYHIETAPEGVRIRRFTLRTRQRRHALLDVRLVVVTSGLRRPHPALAPEAVPGSSHAEQRSGSGARSTGSGSRQGQFLSLGPRTVASP